VIILILITIQKHQLPRFTLAFFKNKTVFLLLLVMFFVFLMFFLPHLSNNYFLPFHVDEWQHWRYTQGFQENGLITYTDPYTGTGIYTHPEAGFHITTACIQWISTSSYSTIFLFMPAIIGVFLSLAAFVIGQRSQRQFGLEAAFLIAFIPTSVRLLGPSFYVPSTLGLFIILSIIWLGQVKKKQSIVFIPFLIVYLFVLHPPTALAAIIIILVYSLFLALDKEYRMAMFTGLSCTIPMAVVVLFSTQWENVINLFIASVTGTKYSLPLNLPKISISFTDLGVVPWALLIIGIAFIFTKERSILRSLSISVITFIAVIGLYDKFGYGSPYVYERMFLYLFLLVVIIAGYGLSEIRRTLTVLVEKNRYRHINKSMIKMNILIPVILCIVILLIAVPARHSTPFYQMITEQEYETFAWIHNNIGEYRDANHSYKKAAIDPFKASPFTAVSGIHTISSSMSPLYGSDLNEEMQRFLREKCTNTSFLDTYQLSVIYGDADNSNLTMIYDKVYIYPGLRET
jgi:hypothetical protein